MTDENAQETNGKANDDDAVITHAAQPGGAGRDLDPTRPMYHLIPPSTMQDVLEILKALPYDKVHRVMPVLIQSPIHQEPPQG